MDDPAAAAHEHVLDAHSETVETVQTCADAVADAWPGDATTDRSAVVSPLERELREAGALSRLPSVLAGAVDSAGFSLRASPVPAPPYVVVTSRGPLLRATVGSGRLLVRFRTFEVERGDETRYVRTSGGLGDSVLVEFRR